MIMSCFRDAEKCFRYNAFYGKRNRFAFFGDSRTKQLYLAMKQYLSGKTLHHNVNTLNSYPNL